MTAKNPFPGMNPFFELRWRDAHTMLIAYIRDALHEHLPEDLLAAVEEETIAIRDDHTVKRLRPDVQVREPWSAAGSGGTAVAGGAVTADEPIIVLTDDEVERWIEIHDSSGRLITAIELLSPTNKCEAWQRERYADKRHTFISSGVNLVEIDLVRQGEAVFPPAVRDLLHRNRAPYGVNVFRATAARKNEVYPIPLRSRLPVIRIPLRPTDADVSLDLQPLIDRCHERGRYYHLDYQAELTPRLSPEDRAWVNELIPNR